MYAYWVTGECSGEWATDLTLRPGNWMVGNQASVEWLGDRYTLESDNGGGGRERYGTTLVKLTKNKFCIKLIISRGKQNEHTPF